MTGIVDELKRNQHRWTPEVMRAVKEARLAEDLRALGKRPPWWRPISRRYHDIRVRRIKRWHANDLRTMLALQDPFHRAIMAHLIGWQLPQGLLGSLPAET